MASATTLDPLVERLRADRAVFPSSATPGTLRVLAAKLEPGQRTLETGCGASTVIFAGRGTEHTAISPSPDEHRVVRDYCAEIGVDHRRVEFIEASSDHALATLAPEPLDWALIDGAHSFPFPIVDWHFVRSRLRVGGTLVLDDAPIPAVLVLVRHLQRDQAWRLLQVVDNRAAFFKKVSRETDEDAWLSQPFNLGYPDYSFLPLRQRLPLVVSMRQHELRGQVGQRYPWLKRLYARVLTR